MSREPPANWRTDTVVDQDAQLASTRSQPYLFTLQGPNAGHRFRLQPGRVTLGRSEKADVTFEDPKMSSLHCALVVSLGSVTVVDLESKNGTYLDGRRIAKMRLDPQSQMRAGNTVMRLAYRTDAEFELETALMQSERLAAVGTLAAGVAHQFNNINAAVLGYAELALQRKNLDDQLQRWLEAIFVSAKRAADLTSNLLTFSGKRPPKARSQHLDQIVSQTLALVRDEYESEGVTWEVDLRELPAIGMDPTQIAQVVLQLFINARHALLARDDKRIGVELGSDKDTVWVKVSDTGCGIPREHLNQVFTPFFSTKGEHAKSRTPQSGVKGPGLGLSVSHAIVSNHGGRLSVESENGKGSTFTLSLPKRPASTSEAPAIRAPSGPLARKRILILEDEEHVRAMFADGLRSAGCKVDGFGDMESALAFAAREGTDLALVDLQLPKGSGQGFLRALRAIPGCESTPTIVVTGVSKGVDRDELGALGVNRIVLKPFGLKDLVAAVSEVLAGGTEQRL